MDSLDIVRVAVAGDAAVGKSCFVKWICKGHQCSDTSYSRTVGCSAEVYLHTYSENGKEYLVEFVDVGGRSKHPNSRRVFYDQIHGLALVHDLSNGRSYQNLSKWYNEALSAMHGGLRRANTSSNFDFSIKVSSGSTGSSSAELMGDERPRLPLVVVGTKLDLMSTDSHRIHPCEFAREHHGSSTDLSAKWTRTSASDQTNQAFQQFLDAAVEQKYFPAVRKKRVNSANQPRPVINIKF